MKRIILSLFGIFILHLASFGFCAEAMKQLAADLKGSNGAAIQSFLDASPNDGGTVLYVDFFEAGKVFPIGNTTKLTKLLKVESRTRKHIFRFTDGTLDELLVDIDNPKFLDFINDPNNEAAVKTMVAHKGVSVSDVEYDLAQEIYNGLSDDVTIDARIRHWIDRSEVHAARQYWFDLGNKFEDDFRKALVDHTPTNPAPEYLALKNKIPDLDDRTILSGVQLCLEKAPCGESGSYFIPDFIAVKKVNGKWDIVVFDTKLKSSSPWTKNQIVAKADKVREFDIKSVNNSNFVRGNSDLIAQLNQGQKTVNIKTKFLKVYSDGQGNFAGGGIKFD